jgi:endonuclease YncB( thermonuclease family)
MAHRLPFLLPFLGLFVATASPAGDTWTGEVASIVDGDTLVVFRGKGRVMVHLHGVDAPEMGQPSGREAKRFLAKLVSGQRVIVTPIASARDKNPSVQIIVYRQLAPKAKALGVNLGTELVKAGLAWWKQKAAPDNKTLSDLEAEARRAKLGLWAQKSPVPPWDWRGSTIKNPPRLPWSKDRICKRDQDCAFRPRFACDPCPPCGASWRTPINVWILKRVRKKEELKDCHRRCSRCRRKDLGTKAVCVKGQCAVQP